MPQAEMDQAAISLTPAPQYCYHYHVGRACRRQIRQKAIIGLAEALIKTAAKLSKTRHGGDSGSEDAWPKNEPESELEF